jgi:hypothetical protein
VGRTRPENVETSLAVVKKLVLAQSHTLNQQSSLTEALPLRAPPLVRFPELAEDPVVAGAARFCGG